MSVRALSEPVVAMSRRLAGPISLAAFALLCGAVVSQPAAAAPKLCGDHDQILKRLEQSPPGNPQAIGLSGDGRMLKVRVSPERGWTMLVTYPKRDAAARRRAGLTVTGETPREDRSVAPTFLNSPAQGCLTT